MSPMHPLAVQVGTDRVCSGETYIRQSFVATDITDATKN